MIACVLSTTTTPPSVSPTRTYVDYTLVIPTDQFTITPTPMRTVSSTSVPLILSTPTIGSTWTELPTLTDSKADFQMQSWLTVNQNCLFPCWGGITPELTTWQEAKQLLRSTVDIKQLAENITCTFGPCNDIEWVSRNQLGIRGGLSSKSDNLVYWMIIDGNKPIPGYRLDRVLSEYGIPEKVFIHTNTFLLGPDNPSLEITLSFPAYQTIIRYTWKAKIVRENVVGCIQDGLIHLDIKPTPRPWADDYIKNEIYGTTDISFSLVRPIEEVTEIDTKDFYEEFNTINGNECISTPSKYWR